MPVVFREGGIRFFFYSNEGDPREPVHIHAESADGVAKVWIDPQPTLASSAGYSRQQLAVIMRIVADREDEIRRRWIEHFR